MYPLLYNFQSFYDYFNNRNIELQKLKKENDILKYKLEGVLIAKNEIRDVKIVTKETAKSLLRKYNISKYETLNYIFDFIKKYKNDFVLK